MIPHLACPLHESSQIGDARRQAARIAEELSFDEVAAGRLALVVTELATNLVKHARDGMLLIGRADGATGSAIEVVSMDRGPGMHNVGHSMTDGTSTSGTAGTGLGAVKRLSNDFHIFSKRDQGTLIVARVAPDSTLESSRVGAPASGLSCAGLCVAAPGEFVSGDSWSCRAVGAGGAILMADGLGHGPDAAEAADAAVAAFLKHPEDGPKDVLERCHNALRGSRGAAVAAINIDAERQVVRFCGAGNIAARLLTGVQDRSLMSQHGTVGLQIRRLQELEYALPEHALLVVHSDGIQSRWNFSETPELLACDPILIAAHIVRDQLRGRDDATVVVARCP